MASIQGPFGSKDIHVPDRSSSEPDPAIREIVKIFPAKVPPGPLPFSGVVAVQVDDGPVVKKSHPSGASFEADRAFNVLSVGKLFTAVATMQLIEDNGKYPRISLETPLSELLTNEEMNVPLDPPYIGPTPAELEKIQANASKITVKHLLSHTAGFLDKDPEPPEWKPELLGHYKYSNFGYQLLAIIIGKHSQFGNPDNPLEGFKGHIREQIFAKANMQGAIDELHQSSIASDPERTDLTEDEKPVVVDPHEPYPYPHGNGCWRMPVNDLLSFASAMRQNLLITEDFFKKMLAEDPPLGFKINKRQDEDKSLQFWGHPGHGPGMSADFVSYSTKSSAPHVVTTAILSNNSIGADLAHEFFEKEFP